MTEDRGGGNAARQFVGRHWVGLTLTLLSGGIGFACSDPIWCTGVGVYGALLYEVLKADLTRKSRGRTGVFKLLADNLYDRSRQLERDIDAGKHTQYVDVTEGQVASTFARVLADVRSAYTAVSVDAFWSPANMDAASFAQENARLAERAQVVRFLILDSSSASQWPIHVRTAVSELYCAAESLPPARRTYMQTYILTYAELGTDWPRMLNFAIWESKSQGQWLVRMSHKDRVFHSIEIIAPKHSADIDEHRKYIVQCQSLIDRDRDRYSIHSPRFGFRRRRRVQRQDEATLEFSGRSYKCNVIDENTDGVIGVDVEGVDWPQVDPSQLVKLRVGASPPLHYRLVTRRGSAERHVVVLSPG